MRLHVSVLLGPTKRVYVTKSWNRNETLPRSKGTYYSLVKDSRQSPSDTKVCHGKDEAHSYYHLYGFPNLKLRD